MTMNNNKLPDADQSRIAHETHQIRKALFEKKEAAAQPQRREQKSGRIWPLGHEKPQPVPQRTEQQDKWNLEAGQALPHLPECKQGKHCTCPYGYGENKIRSEQQKWTWETVRTIVNQNWTGGRMVSYGAVADAHNAAIDAALRYSRRAGEGEGTTNKKGKT